MLFQNKIQFSILIPTNNTVVFFFFILKYLLMRNQLKKLKINFIQLPKTLKKFTLLKSPHVHKTSFTQLEFRQKRNILTIKNFESKKIINTFLSINNYFIKNFPSSTKITLKRTQLFYI